MVLLDNQSTIDQLVNSAYLSNMHDVDIPINGYYNDGSTITNRKGLTHGILRKITSLKTLKSKHWVTHDSNDCSRVFITHTLWCSGIHFSFLWTALS